MRAERLGTALIYLLILPGVIGLVSCAKPQQPAVESPPQAARPPAPEAPPSPADLPKPQPAELEAKANSIFKGAVIVDNSHNPPFVVGDFNGDLSQDIAIVVKPIESRLDDLNHELSPWLRGDPLQAVLPKPQVVTKDKPANERIRFLQTDTLLAVVHGYDADGWRNPQATQTYLLRNSVGSDLRMDLKKDIFALRKKGAKLPIVRGYVVRETIGGEAGFLYYNGARYLWYDPKTFKGELAP